jgi:ATP-dependent Lon protease
MSVPTVVPVVGAGRLVLFPGMRCQVHLHTAESQAAMVVAAERSGSVALFASRTDGVPQRARPCLQSVGVLAQVLELGTSDCCGRPAADLQATSRVQFNRWRRLRPFREASCSILRAPVADARAMRLAFEIAARVNKLGLLFPHCVHTAEAATQVASVSTPEALLGAVAGLLAHLPTGERQRMLESDSLATSLEVVLIVLHERIARAQATSELPSRRD